MSGQNDPEASLVPAASDTVPLVANAPVRMAAIGLAHPHIFAMTQHLLDAGAELVAYEPEAHALGEAFAQAWDHAEARSERAAILEDPSIQVIVGAGVPDERGSLGAEVLRHEKDFVSDKPAFTTRDAIHEVRRVHAETGRRFVVWFSERLDSRATLRACALIRDGAIGDVVHTIGLGPHRLDAALRPAWFFDRARYGGILCDLASHQVDQFLAITRATDATVTAARVANRAHPEHPGLQDFGEAMLEASGASGYVRVDWFTPAGMPTWGDGRLLVVGTDGQIEVRKNVDVEGRAGGDHLFLVDGNGPSYVDCSAEELPFARQLLRDVAERTEVAISQEHCLRVSEIALTAQAAAESPALRRRDR